MGKFEVIAGSGHCGTMWLSKVLNAATDTSWHHEKRRMVGPWLDQIEYGVGATTFDPYWWWMKNELILGNVGDSNSWLPPLLPQVDDIVPIDRVIYLTRNPIQQLHSLDTKSYVWSHNVWPAIADGYLYSLRLIGVDRYRPWEEWTRWEKLCLLVAANDFMPDWLRERGLNVQVYSLEELTGSVDALQKLAAVLSHEEARRWQKRDVNRKVYGPRDPETLWGKWTDEQRDGFRRVVGAVTEIESGEPA